MASILDLLFPRTDEPRGLGTGMEGSQPVRQQPMGMGAPAGGQPQPGGVMAPQGTPAMNLFGGGQGGGEGFKKILGALGPALMMASGDPNFMQAGMSIMADKRKTRQAQGQANQTAQFYMGLGAGPEEAAYLASNKEAGNAYYKAHREGEQPDWKIVDLDDGKYMVDMRNPERRERLGGAAADKPPSAVQEYEYAKSQGYQGSFEDWKREGAAAAAPKTVGTPPAGYRVEYDERGNPTGMSPIPGSPAAMEAEQAASQAESQQKSKELSTNIVTEDIDRALSIIDNSTLPTTGALGDWISSIGGTAAADLKNLLNTVGSNIGFDRLQKMRDESPTGGALGQVSERELDLLMATAGSVKQSQSAEQLKYNLNRLYEVVMNTVHGEGNWERSKPDESEWQEFDGVRIRRKQ